MTTRADFTLGAAGSESTSRASTDSNSSFDFTTSSLPFPKPLARADFLQLDFDPTAFLSSFTNRHQTLEDLRTELRNLSRDLQKELLDLINDNYTDFLTLGSSLKGGEEKIEEVRVGLLAFQRDVAAVKEKLDERKVEVRELLDQKRGLSREIATARVLLELGERLDALEDALLLSTTDAAPSEPQDEEELLSDLSSDSGSDDDAVGASAISVSKLSRHAQRFRYIEALVRRVGPEHPFIVRQEERLLRLKNTILLDLKTALGQARAMGKNGQGRALKVLKIYGDLGEQREAVMRVKGS